MTQRKTIIEESLLTKTSQALTIKQLLQIPSEYRTHQHCKSIINHVKDVKFLERYMDSDQIYDLAKEFQLKAYDSNVPIFKQGEPADAFYIILAGSVKVFITVPSEVKHFSNIKEVMKLDKGDAFGELALLYDSVRSATIITHEHTELIVLNKDSFRKHIRTISTTHLSQIMEYFKDFPAFQSLQVNEIAKYAAKSIIYKFPSNTVIIREGDVPHEIYFVKSGRVKVIRRVNFKVHHYTRNLLLNDYSEPTADEIERGLYKSQLIEIDELSSGDSFCDYALLNKQGMHHSIVCSIPCELIALPVYDLNDLDETTIREYKTILKPYPEDSELRKMYLDLNKWNAWKKKLCQNINIEKINKRRGFDQQLRQPFMKMVSMEKFTIPLQGNLDLDLLETPKMIKSYTSKAGSLVGANFFEIDSSAISKKKRLTTNYENDRSNVGASGFLPKIDKASYRDSVESNGETLMSSVNRNLKGHGNKHRKFEFVVPQHRMLKTEEKSENKTEENLLDLDNTQQISGHYHGGTREVRVPHPFDMDNIVPNREGSIGDQGSPVAENSLLGTHEMANAFTQVMNTMSSGGFNAFKLPSIRR